MSPLQPGAHLHALDRKRCLQLLEGRGLGRVGATVRGGPVILPVNYAVVGASIVFRIRRGSDLEEATRDALVAFEIDGTDDVYHEGWSVLVTGRCAHVTDPAEIDRLDQARLTPWAGADRDLFVTLPLESVSGRSIDHRVR